MPWPLHGACQCGNIRYKLMAPPLRVIACHCRDCQKLSASAFSITAIVPWDAVEVEGELAEWTRIADSGNRNVARFCPICGNRIYHFNPDDPVTLKLKPSTLADTRFIRPTVHAWVCRKQAWYEIPPDVEVYEKQ